SPGRQEAGGGTVLVAGSYQPDECNLRGPDGLERFVAHRHRNRPQDDPASLLNPTAQPRAPRVGTVISTLFYYTISRERHGFTHSGDRRSGVHWLELCPPYSPARRGPGRQSRQVDVRRQPAEPGERSRQQSLLL